MNTFQDQEYEEETGWVKFKWRNHQPEIGRFFNVDPLTEDYVTYSPYSFSGNKLTSHIELEGLEEWSIKNVDHTDGTIHGPYKNQEEAQKAANANPAPGGFIRSSNITKNRIANLEKRDFTGPVENIVLHRTAGSSVDQALAAYESRGYGTHFIVGPDGEIQQNASLNKVTYHVGKKKSKDQLETSFNSIGIEVVGSALDSEGNVTLDGNLVESWEALTDAQLNSVSNLVNTLYKLYNLNVNNVKVHEDLANKTEGEGETVRQTVYDCINNCSDGN